MSSQFKTKDFKKLRLEWYKKLANEGFSDAEHPTGKLKLMHSDYFADRRRNSKEFVLAKQSYYRLAGQFLYSHTFAEESHRFIWKHHSDGLSMREIERLLRGKFPKMYKDNIQKIINILEKEMIDKETGKTR